MIKIRNTDVYGFQHAIKGMRNPKNSWNKSDSEFVFDALNNKTFILGNNDLKLAQRLLLAGTEHAKYTRFIAVWCDMTLPLKVWKEFDTYKFVEKNSTSTMHKITSRQLTENDFDYKEFDEFDNQTINHINDLIDEYNFSQNKERKQIIFDKITDKLPSSFLQTRTVVTNYQELRNIFFQRRYHKLSQWHEICDWIQTLPYAKELITLEKQKESDLK